MPSTLRVGSRPSPLALRQTDIAVAALRRVAPAGTSFEVVEIATTGDRVRDRPVSEIGTKAAFTSELQSELERGGIDLAVHSAKDLGAAEPPGLKIAAVPARADPRDVLVSSGGARLEALKPGARVGTSSLRRRAQLRAVRGDLEVVPVRGNVGTRVDKVVSGEVDAVVLAAAGLLRMGLEDRVAEWLDPRVFVPAPGQGALAIEAAADRLGEDLGWVVRADEADSRDATDAERHLLAIVGAGCGLPLGAWARVEGDAMLADAFVAHPDGAPAVRAAVTTPRRPLDCAAALVAALRERGAGPLLEGIGGVDQAR